MRIKTAFLILVSFAAPATAADGLKTAFIPADSVEQAIEKFVAPDLRAAAARRYESEMNPATGEISISGLYGVCAAAGWDVANDDGFGKCWSFVNEMVLAIGNRRGFVQDASRKIVTEKHLNPGANPGPECWGEDVFMNYICDADGRQREWGGALGPDFAAGRISAAEYGTDEWRTPMRLRMTQDEAMKSMGAQQHSEVNAPSGGKTNFEVRTPIATASVRG